MEPVEDGDIPEDWLVVYNIALNNMNWRNGNRLIIHNEDAVTHITDYSIGDNYPLEGPKLDN